MVNPVAEAVVRKTVLVKAPIDHAFRVFVERMESWWPATHHIGNTPFQAIFIEPRVGGRWYEINAEGAQCEWGQVLAWDPPHQVTFSWHLGPGHDQADWKFDPDLAKASEVEIRFTAQSPATTLVELTHSKLQRHGEGFEQLRAIFDGPGAWSAILELYAQTTNGVQAP